MSPNVEAVANPLATACESGYVPDKIHILENPGLSNYLDRVTLMLERIVVEYGSEQPEIAVTSLDSETEFEQIVEHYRAPVLEARETDEMAAVDVTPGRKFMSASHSRQASNMTPSTSSISTSQKGSSTVVSSRTYRIERST